MKLKITLHKHIVQITCLLLYLFSSSAYSQNLTILIAGSAKQTGIIESIAEQFKSENPTTEIDFRYGSSLKLFEEAKKGSVDIVISHYPEGEEGFKNDGFALLQARFMYNKFVIMGPKEDEYQLTSKPNLKEVLSTLSENEVDFYTPSNYSGTKKHLDKLWKKANISPDWLGYEETSLSGPSTMRSANSMSFYTFVDMSSYAVNKSKITNIIPLFRDDIQLNNYYTITIVKENKVGRHNQQQAETFFNYLISAQAQQFIQQYGATKYGIDLYTPYARFDKTVIKLQEQRQSDKEALLQDAWCHTKRHLEPFPSKRFNLFR